MRNERMTFQVVNFQNSAHFRRHFDMTSCQYDSSSLYYKTYGSLPLVSDRAVLRLCTHHIIISLLLSNLSVTLIQ